MVAAITGGAGMSSQIDFTDKKHSVAELAFQGAEEMDLEQSCTPEMLDVLAMWRDRTDHQASGSELFHTEHCTAFSHMRRTNTHGAPEIQHHGVSG
jgi:hypothetical protein